MRAGPGLILAANRPFPQARPKAQTWTIFVGLVAIYTITAIAFDAWRDGGEIELIASLTLAGFLLILSWIDLDRFLLPDVLTLPLIALGLLYSSVWGGGVIPSLLGAVIGYGLIAILAWFWRNKTGRDGIGLGDAKLLAAAGTWLGVFMLPVTLLLSSGSILIIIFLLRTAAKPQKSVQYFPLGPLLSLSIWFVWCAGISDVLGR